MQKKKAKIYKVKDFSYDTKRWFREKFLNVGSSLSFTNKKIVHFIVSIAFALSPVKVLSAQSQIYKTVKSGLENCYNFNWKAAQKDFTSLINKYPDDPRGYHYEASIYLWYFMSNQNKSDLNSFVAYSDTALDKAKTELEKNPKNVNILYLIGADYSYRAIAFSKAGKFIDAAWSSKKAESYLSESLANDSTLYDSYLGLGLYNFAIGQIPSAYRWALSLAGIKGDKITGIKYIKLAAKKGNLSKVEAEYYLSEILSNYFDDYSEASKTLKNLITKYPSNILFNYSYGVIEIKQRKLGAAKKVLTKILKQDSSKFHQIISYSNLLMGDIYFRENNFDSAEVYYHNFISSTLDNDYKGIAYYRMALSYEIVGKRDTAEKYYKLTSLGNMDIDDDIYAKRKGDYYYDHPLTPNKIELIKDNNLIESAQYQAAYDSLQSLLPRVVNEESKAEAYLRLSEASYGLGQYDESFNYAISAKDSDNTEIEKWIAPFACYYAARAQKMLGNEELANSFIEKAESYSNYDYQNKLKNILYSLSFKS